MARRAASAVLLFALILGAASAATQQQIPNPGNSSADASKPRIVPKPQPDQPPLPPDVKTSDPARPEETTKGNAVTRTLKKLAPNCIDAIFHSCWSAQAEKPLPSQTDERKGEASRKVGEFYVERRNYPAAESRFREALQYNPGDAKATFELAQCLEKSNRFDDAAGEYKAYLDLQPTGAYAEKSRGAIQRLSSGAAK